MATMFLPRKMMALFFIATYFTSALHGKNSSRTYRIGTYNLENLWDFSPHNTDESWNKFLKEHPNSKNSRAPRSIQYEDYSLNQSNWYRKNIIHKKITNVITAIKLAKTPDILAIQELECAGNDSKVFSLPYYKSTLRNELMKLGYQYQYLGQQDPGNPVSVTTGFISKVPLTPLPSVSLFFPKDISSSRDIQVMAMDLPGERLVLFNGHWKSKRGGRTSELYRIQTAKAIRNRIQEYKKRSAVRTHFIVLGDLNTSYFEEPLQYLNVTGDETKMLSGATDQLYNLWFELPEDSRWEYSYNGVRGALSHIIVSDSLYNRQGLHYIDQSFEVIGHKGIAKKVLMNVDGKPLRWQIMRRAGKSYHAGVGYSDHLPLVASFQYSPPTPQKSIEKQVLENPSIEEAYKAPGHVLFNKVRLCREKASIDLLALNHTNPEELLGKCVKIIVPEEQDAFKLKTIGHYRQNYVYISPKRRTPRILITMNRSYDWRPNIDDSRVTVADASLEVGRYGPHNWHPLSNICFTRKVLQKRGGSLRRAVGRLGYQNGYLAIFIASQEPDSIILEDLPTSKKQACGWQD